MPEKTQKDYFEAISKSVVNLHSVETSITTELQTVVQFVDFLRKKADETEKFRAVENDVVEYLNNFAFAGKMDFSAMQNKLEKLPDLMNKIGVMGAEHKKIKDAADRYDCHKTVGACKKLASFFVNEMKSADIDRAITALDAVIPKLCAIQNEFETEKQILNNINKIVNQNTAVIGKYKAYKAELDQFVAAFPNNRDTDLKTVEQRIATLNKLDKVATELGVETQKMTTLPDRHDCHKTLEVCKKLIALCVNEMKSTEIDRVITAINANIPKLKAIQKKFEAEKQIEAELKRLLNQHMAVLNKYAAFKTELSNFSGSDLKIVEQQLVVLNDVDKLCQQIEGMIAQVQNFADKYQKNDTLRQVLQQIDFAKKQMKMSDTNKVKQEFAGAINKLQQLTGEFDKEVKKVKEMLKDLQQLTPDCWQEETEILIADLTEIAKKDPRKNKFVLQDFQNRIQKARDKKKQEIESFELHNSGWLKKRKNSEKFDAEIRNKYVSFADFKTFVDSKKGLLERILNI